MIKRDAFDYAFLTLVAIIACTFIILVAWEIYLFSGCP
jgi:hypothetical protein